MKSAKLGCLAMRRSRRHGDPRGGIGQVESLLKIELGVVAQTSRFVSGWISRTQDRKRATVERRCAFAGAVGDADVELRRAIVENRKDQCCSRFRTGVYVARKVDPEDAKFSGGGYTGSGRQTVSTTRQAS